ncbi:MAG: hypothetical protein Q8P39_02730 [Candidatus Yanofskybacteria bacterium]|nr:hypothetical protein [Candidatus Yanofskybacteria bacterium]
MSGNGVTVVALFVNTDQNLLRLRYESGEEFSSASFHEVFSALEGEANDGQVGGCDVLVVDESLAKVIHKRVPDAQVLVFRSGTVPTRYEGQDVAEALLELWQKEPEEFKPLENDKRISRGNAPKQWTLRIPRISMPKGWLSIPFGWSVWRRQ